MQLLDKTDLQLNCRSALGSTHPVQPILVKLLLLGVLLGIASSSLKTLHGGQVWQEEEAAIQAPSPGSSLLFFEKKRSGPLPIAKEPRVEKTPARDDGDDQVQQALRHSALSQPAPGGLSSARQFFLIPPPRAPPVWRV